MVIPFLLHCSSLLKTNFIVVSRVIILCGDILRQSISFNLSWVARVIFTKSLVLPIPLDGFHVPYSSFGIYEYSLMKIQMCFFFQMNIKNMNMVIMILP